MELTRSSAQSETMLGQDEILEALKEVPKVEIARVIGAAGSRVTELYKGERRLKLDEAQKLVAHYGLHEQGGLSEPVARMAVLWVAESLGKALRPSDQQLEELALDLQALSEFAARPEARKSLDRVAGFLDGRKRASPRRVMPS